MTPPIVARCLVATAVLLAVDVSLAQTGLPAKLEIYQEIQGTLNPQVSAIQAAAEKLAERYPLNSIPLKKCIAD